MSKSDPLKEIERLEAERIKRNRELFASMSESQVNSMNELMSAVRSILEVYSEFSHPFYDDIVKLDNCYHKVRNSFDTGV